MIRQSGLVEGILNRHELKEWVDRGCIEMPQPDAGRVGIMEFWRVVRMAGLADKPFCPHSWGDGSCTLANAALVAASPNALMLEQFETYDPLRTEIFIDPLVVVDGYMDLPERPGFGVELAPDLERRFPYQPGGYSARENPVICGGGG